MQKFIGYAPLLAGAVIVLPPLASADVVLGATAPALCQAESGDTELPPEPPPQGYEWDVPQGYQWDSKSSTKLPVELPPPPPSSDKLLKSYLKGYSPDEVAPELPPPFPMPKPKPNPKFSPDLLAPDLQLNGGTQFLNKSTTGPGFQ